MTELATVDVLIIDDFALEPMSREESRDIYQLFVERSEQGGCRDVAGRPDIRRLGERDGGRRICVDRPAIGRFPNPIDDVMAGAGDTEHFGRDCRAKIGLVMGMLP